MVKVLPVL